MKNLNLVVVKNGNEICFGNDVTHIEIKDDKLAYVCEGSECREVYALDHTDTVIIKIDR